MNRKGEVKLIPMIMGMLAMFMFIAIVSVSIVELTPNYDTSGYDSDDLSKYNFQSDLSSDITSAKEDVKNVGIDPNIFDYLAGIFKTLLAPIKTIYGSFTALTSMASSLVGDFSLLSPIGEFLTTAIVLIVVIGIVMLTLYLGKQK